MTTSLVTIGIAAHNRAAFLPQTVDSALKQTTEAPYEILIVDDASSDGTRGYLESLTDPRVRVLFRDENGGESVVRNQMVSEINSEWLIWLDDDDILLEHALESHLTCAARNPDADIIYGNLKFIDKDNRETGGHLTYTQIEPSMTLYRLLVDNMLANGGTLTKRSVFDRVGEYAPEIRRSMDYEFWARAAIQGCRFIHNDAYLYLYRAHSGNCINPREQDPDHHRQYAGVVSKILDSAEIERIFPMLDWANQPEQSLVRALSIIATIYLKWDHFDEAIDAIDKAEQFLKTRETVAIRGLIHKAAGHHEESAKLLSTALLSENNSAILDLLKAGCLNVGDDLSHVLE